ncbi:flavin-containing monooxygenase [Sphingomonas canadensis]|uniref:Flavin-containing monooxygenase n=1 Tax=Sphingomonas canadensis TaxID=1219257 RepID=A0ABW3HD86_9SPHN|nr:NAD(P)/FAD-dependent oxidoreductase [Sphingomonas canadensis]MCW3838071.1 NAD(P)/FAD-dependent oxidoreductase [Sphingomonas canadensis]
MSEHFDVLIVGAGISGIGTAWHLQKHCPDRSYAILEGRACKGGTWDLFRYPGIRSDSDMFTLGYSFRPWTGAKAIADGPSILQYLEDTAAENGIEPHIRYGHRVTRAEWSTPDALWTVTVEAGGETRTFTCSFLSMCSGYYRYDRGYLPEWEGTADYKGRIIHPQFWPEDLDYAGKRVVVIGSGATAVTIVPEMAKRAAHVTMLQRSPTYVASLPSEDAIANWLRKRLPAKTAYAITRWKNVLISQFFFSRMRKNPEKAKERLVGMVREHLGPDYDVATHFTPKYNPWDQRLCAVPDADMFEAIKSGAVSVETDTIERFTGKGLKLASGKELEADIIVTATGLDLQIMGGVPLIVDGKETDVPHALTYKGMMLSDVPNMAFTFGYTNASWTLKADLTSEYVCRLLNAMKSRGMRQVTPRPKGPVEEIPFVDFSSGYIQRAVAHLPKQGARKPWRLNQRYTRDLMALRFGGIDDEMEFSNPVAKAKAA